MAGLEGIQGFLNELDRTVVSLMSTCKQCLDIAKVLKKSTAQGNLDDIAKQLEAIGLSLREATELCQAGRTLYSSMSFPELCQDSYGSELEQACRERGLPIEGSFPYYEVFPCEIRVDVQKRTIEIDGKTYHTVAPQVVARIIESERNRLYKSRFDARQFAETLLRAYDLLVATKAVGKPEDCPQVRLKDVYSVLTLLPGASRQYSIRQFAFDLHRLKASQNLTVGDREIVLGTTRSARNAIRVPSSLGGKENLGYMVVRRVIS